MSGQHSQRALGLSREGETNADPCGTAGTRDQLSHNNLAFLRSILSLEKSNYKSILLNYSALA